MNQFSFDEARHYCSGFQPQAGRASYSLKDYLNLVQRDRIVAEGTPEFGEYKTCSLRETERLLFLSAVQLRRVYDLFSDASSPWAHVTLYYGAFFSASAILNMFGVWIDPDKCVVYVENGAIGQQSLNIRKDKHYLRNLTPTIQAASSHKKFWTIFYQVAASLKTWIPDPATKIALDPVNNNSSWLIDRRNDVNYDSYQSFQLINDFRRAYKARNFRSTLPGNLNTQFKVAELLIKIAFSFASQLNLSTDALQQCFPKAPRNKTIHRFLIDNTIKKALNKNEFKRMLN